MISSACPDSNSSTATQPGSGPDPAHPDTREREALIRLLLVEDDAESREAMQLMLEKRGLAVATSMDAEEALSRFSPADFDIVVSDIRLDGMNGVRLLGKIRDQWPDFPVILLTGYDSIESAIQAVRLGAQDYILKPLESIEDLLVPVRKAVRAYRLTITNRLLEHDLRESREFSFSLLNNSPNPVVVLNPDTTIRYVNPALEQLTGWTTGELAGRPSPYPWWNAEAEWQRPDRLRDAMENGIRNREVCVFNRQGREFWTEITFVPVKQNDRLLYCLTNWVNITERKQAEESLKASQAQLRELAARLETIRENERTRMAREIHDEMGHRLTALRVDLDWMSRHIGRSVAPDAVPGLRDKIGSATGLVDQTIQTVRRLATELRTSLLDDLGLAAAIEWRAQQFQQAADIRCTVAGCNDEYPLLPDQATALFRIFEEILSNVARHAQASAVTVDLGRIDGHVRLAVHDNGKGIDRARIASPQSLGLLGMRERMRMLGGRFSISGTPGSGTIVEVEVPLDASTRQQEQKDEHTNLSNTSG